MAPGATVEVRAKLTKHIAGTCVLPDVTGACSPCHTRAVLLLNKRAVRRSGAVGVGLHNNSPCCMYSASVGQHPSFLSCLGRLPLWCGHLSCNRPPKLPAWLPACCGCLQVSQVVGRGFASLFNSYSGLPSSLEVRRHATSSTSASDGDHDILSARGSSASLGAILLSTWRNAVPIVLLCMRCAVLCSPAYPKPCVLACLCLAGQKVIAALLHHIWLAHTC
jgi:hypothetical protein